MFAQRTYRVLKVHIAGQRRISLARRATRCRVSFGTRGIREAIFYSVLPSALSAAMAANSSMAC